MASRQVWNLKGSGQRKSTRTWIKKGIYWVPFKRRSIKSILLSILKGADLITSPLFTSFTTLFRYTSAKSQPWNVHVLSRLNSVIRNTEIKQNSVIQHITLKQKFHTFPFTPSALGAPLMYSEKKTRRTLARHHRLMRNNAGARGCTTRTSPA